MSKPRGDFLEHLDSNLQSYIGRYPDALDEEKLMDADFLAEEEEAKKLIVAVVRASLMPVPGSGDRDYFKGYPYIVDKTKGYQFLDEKIHAYREAFNTEVDKDISNAMKDIAKAVSENLFLSKGLLEKRIKVIGETTYSNVVTYIINKLRDGAPASGTISQLEEHILQVLNNEKEPFGKALRSALWTRQERVADLMIKSLGYPPEVEGKIVDERGATGYFIREFSEAKLLRNPTANGKIQIPIAPEFQQNLKDRLDAALDENGQKIFADNSILYNPTEQFLEMRIAKFDSKFPQESAKKFVKAIRSSILADWHKEEQITQRTSSTIKNITAGLATVPAIISIAPAGVTAFGHKILSWVPGAGDALYGAALGFSKFAQLSLEKSRFNSLRRLGATAKGIADSVIRTEKNVVANPFVRLFKFPTAVAGLAVSAAGRGVELGSNLFGDAFSYAARYYEEIKNKPIRSASDAIEYTTAVFGWGASTIIATPFRVLGLAGKTIADSGAVFCDRFEENKGRVGLSVFAKISKGLKRGTNNARYFRNEKIVTAALSNITPPVIAEDDKRNSWLEASRDFLNNAKGLKFTESVKGHINPYATLTTVAFGQKEYQILGSFNGKDIFVREINSDRLHENKINELPANLGLSKEGGLVTFNTKVFANFDRALQNMSGVSLTDFRQVFVAVAAIPGKTESAKKQDAAKDLLSGRYIGETNATVVEGLGNDERIICGDYQLRKTGDDFSLSSTTRGGGNMDFKTNLFFNYLQDVASRDIKVTKLSEPNSVIRNPKSNKVDRSEQENRVRMGSADFRF